MILKKARRKTYHSLIFSVLEINLFQAACQFKTLPSFDSPYFFCSSLNIFLHLLNFYLYKVNTLTLKNPMTGEEIKQQ